MGNVGGYAGKLWVDARETLGGHVGNVWVDTRETQGGYAGKLWVDVEASFGWIRRQDFHSLNKALNVLEFRADE